jgi:hypothetical protein
MKIAGQPIVALILGALFALYVLPFIRARLGV